MRHPDHSGRAISLGLLAAIPILLIGSVHGAIIVVPDSYTTIQAAITAATAGDTIQVKGKSTAYNEKVDVDESLTLEGLSTVYGFPIVIPSSGDAFTLTASGCTVRHFIVDGARKPCRGVTTRPISRAR